MAGQNTELSQKVAAGLLLWLFFGISLTALEYPLWLTIAVGAIAGGTGIWIMDWWHDTTPPPPGEEDSDRPAPSPGPPSMLVTNLRRTHAPGIEEAQRLRIAEEARRRRNPNQRRRLFVIPRVFRRPIRRR